MNLTPARYFPFANGRYEVTPGLSRLGRDFGNGLADQQVFQIDREFGRYRQAKLASRQERFEQYVCESNLSRHVREHAARFILERLPREHPELFDLRSNGEHVELKCDPSGEVLCFDSAMNLVVADAKIDPPYRDALDALAGQITEDFAIISADSTGDHWLSYLHLCFPNHWAAEEKIGRRFEQIHAPVAGIEPINRRSDLHVRTMLAARDGLVRFAWGLATDDQLNHHPSRDRITAARHFDPANPRAFVRVERQTIWGFPDGGAALFTIRTSFIDCEQLKRSDPQMTRALAAAVESMPPESAQYKGLSNWRDDFIAWLHQVE